MSQKKKMNEFPKRMNEILPKTVQLNLGTSMSILHVYLILSYSDTFSGSYFGRDKLTDKNKKHFVFLQ